MRSPSRSTCSRFHHAVELIGRRWNGAILQAVLRGTHRYAEIKDAIPGVNDTMLSQRLRELEAEKLLERRVLPSSPVRVEYYGTEKAQALAPALEAVMAWAEEWIELPTESTSLTEMSSAAHDSRSN
jgi:DNA-binding HxlR family transcriptional regulator